MSTAAGLGALGEGFIRGMKLGSDMNDAEQRRGLQGLQMKREQQALDRDKQMGDLSAQIAKEYADYRDGGGAYAPAEGQTYNRTDSKVADIHYSRIEPLLQQQAALSGKNPALVSKEIRDLRREGFAENVFRASQLLEMGDPSGAEILKPLYNNMFPDGTTVGSTTYDKASDSFKIQTIRDGVATDTQVPRAKLVDMLNYGALNPADAVKMRMREREKETDRKFEADEKDKDRGLKKELNESDNKAAMQRTQVSAGATVQAARIGQDSRRASTANARDDKDYDDFQGQINDALGWNKSNPLVTPEQLQARNRDAAAMTGIFNTTRELGGRKLSAYEVAQVNNFLKLPRQEQQRLIKEEKAAISQKNGHTIVDVNGIRAVLPGQN